MKADKIYALFSVENNYDQPPNNLVAWWHEKPSLEILAKALGRSFPDANDEVTLKLVKIWGMETEQRISDTDYRLDHITPGKIG